MTIPASVTATPTQPQFTAKTNIAIGQQNLFTLAPKTLSEAMEYAKIIASSSMVPKSFQGQPGDVLVAVQMGAELGLPPTQALQNIAVINGRPSLWGDAVLAIVKGSALCDYVREYFDAEKNIASCVAKRKNDAEAVTRIFSYEDAKRAGLWGKQGPWTQYPQRMAQMRARSWAVRDAFPDLLRGLSVAEEQQDVVEKTITPINKTDEANSIAHRAEALLNHLKMKSVSIDNEVQDHPKVSLQFIVEQIEQADHEQALTAVAEHAKHLSEDEQVMARDKYKQKLSALRQLKQTNETDITDDIFAEMDDFYDEVTEKI